MLRSFTTLLVSTIASSVIAQEPLSIDRIFSGEFEPEPALGSATWQADGKTLVDIQAGRIVSIEAATGKTSTLVGAAELKGFVPESVTRTGNKLLLFGNSRKVWRLNTRGDYAVFDLTARRFQRIGPPTAKSELMFAKLSPDARRVGYVYRNDIFVVSLDGGRTARITRDGSKHIINGTFDWVYEEELGLRDGWRWSPDGKSIAFWQLDTRLEPVFTLVDQSKKGQVLKQFPYPHPGDPNASARIGVAPVSGGRVRWMKPIATPWNGYLARMDWVPNSSKLLVQFLNRRQNRLDFNIVDSKTGKEERIWNDTDTTWVDMTDTGSNGVAWIGGGKQFLAVSERSGRRHVYAIGMDGRSRDLTPGNLDVDAFGIQAVGDAVYFYASPEDAAQRYLYRTTAAAIPKRSTPNGLDGTHIYALAPKGNLAIHEYSKLGEPPMRELVDLREHRRVRGLTSNSTLATKLSSVKKGSIERRAFLAADGKSSMDAILVYPPDFDASKKYPVFFDIYGGPSGTTVSDRWLGFQQLFWWMLAEKGYIIATVDNRGTPALKGRAWRKSIYLKMNPIIAADLASAARQMAALPFVDASRIGLWGWSSGGTNTLQSLFSYPDVWSLGIAVAPIGDIGLYDTIYTERYSGLPSENPHAYFNDSPVNFVRGLRGNLFIAYGTGDDNCHSQNTEWLIDRMVAERKRFTVMPYPNRTHEVSEGRGTIQHLFDTIVEFLTRNMLPGPK